MRTDKYYRTSDLDLASFLLAKVKNMPETQWIGNEKKEFPFDKTPYLEELREIFLFGDRYDDRLLINVKDLQIARKQLIERLKRG
jgi:hypothetical protein